MNSLILKFSCAVGIILLTGSESAFLSFPRNEIVLANKRVEFQCSTDSDKPLRWYVSYAGRKESVAIIPHGNLASAGQLKYTLDTRIRGQCNLIIESVNISFAGKYRCSEGFSGPEVEGELAVVDSQPLCQVNASSIDNSVGLVENDNLWMQCSLSFSGNMNLNKSWIRKSTGSVLQDASNSRNQSMVVIQVNSSDNGETFTFKATFGQENNSRETVIMWNFTVKVFYAPRNLVIKSDSSVYVVGDHLECSADGNPIPNYEWTDIETNKTTYGFVLAIKEYITPDQTHTFTCTAYNTVDGLRKHISDTVTFNVSGSTTTRQGSSATIIGSVVTMTILCIAIVIVVLVCRRVSAKAWTLKPCVLIADPEPDVVRSDPMTHDNHYYEIEDLTNEGVIALTSISTDDSVTPQTEPAFSIYELIGEEGNETMADGLSPPQQVRTPAYTKVNKNDRLLKTHQGSNTIGLQSTMRSADATQTNYFGADGTEYTEVNSFGDRPVAPTPNSSMFRPVDNYAMIDHTRRAPPPLPKL